MKLSVAKAKHPDEWMAFRIEADGEDPEGEVVLHEKDRTRFRELLHAKRVRDVYITFSGEVLSEKYAAMF